MTILIIGYLHFDKSEKFLGTKWAPKIKALQLTIFRSHKGQLGPYTFKGM